MDKPTKDEALWMQDVVNFLKTYNPRFEYEIELIHKYIIDKTLGEEK